MTAFCEQSIELSGSINECGSGELVAWLVNYPRADSHGLYSGPFHEAVCKTRGIVTTEAMDETEA